MNVLTAKLPSKGYGCMTDLISVKPLTYLELTDYASVSPEGELACFIHDFEVFIMTIPNWKELSSFDCNALIAMRKMLSIDLKGSFSLSDGKEFTLQDVDFTDIEKLPLSLKEVSLNGVTYQPSIKSMDKFYHTLKLFEKETSEIKFPVIASYVGIEDPKVIFEFTTSDIAICERLYRYLLSQPKISKESAKGGVEAVLFGKASDLFQSVVTLCKIDPSDLRFSEDVQV